MKKILLSAIMTVCGLGYSDANVGLNRSILGIEGVVTKENTDKTIVISKTATEQPSIIQAGKTPVLVQEIENVGLEKAPNTKVVVASSMEFIDDNFIYVKERKDLVGYALQLASFSDLSLAKDFALSIAHKGYAEKRQLFIYSPNNPEKTFYKVYFGLLKSDELAREKQQTLLSVGYTPFVKEFR